MLENNTHENLIASYNARYLEIDKYKKLNKSDIEDSISLFEKETLIGNNPIPKKLEVFCLVAGLPFSYDFIKKIIDIQKQIKEVINCLHYFVEPQNLAAEVVVLKWPLDEYQKKIIENGIKEVKKINIPKFELFSYGFQFHSDGAIILRCVDEDQIIRKLRKNLMKNIPGLPKKQSNWFHIPLGRILEPIDEKTLQSLKYLANNSQEKIRFKTKVSQLHLVHEKRWYQIDRETLFTLNL